MSRPKLGVRTCFDVNDFQVILYDSLFFTLVDSHWLFLCYCVTQRDLVSVKGTNQQVRAGFMTYFTLKNALLGLNGALWKKFKLSMYLVGMYYVQCTYRVTVILDIQLYT